ncbi:2OG-Fe(II) oxygenase [Sphingomonas sp. BIUV-7]|uniref:2OG-Fe(II) oxygenase n=1 Tax=Sphingomonas natans TaxID=3063330 RepID=A0ABT8YCX2_9SPHN|nr:2OG-Fe(II) oxygenase [Sphingomonas sp. BIUV-7]MDO6416171.1 2OG-Fe(II) oxygenase [Sphingomonas sp. BIUV-7]
MVIERSSVGSAGCPPSADPGAAVDGVISASSERETAFEPDMLETLILLRLGSERERVSADFRRSREQGCGTAIVDDLLPTAVREAIFSAVPTKDLMLRRQSLGERKYCMAQTVVMPSTLQNCVKAFASPELADALSGMIDVGRLVPDANLYNGGVTVMSPGDFMRPHLDNSHNRNRRRRRRLVALYYLSPVWEDRNGGELRIWSCDPVRQLQAISFRPNRLVLLEVSDTAWHSVEPIHGDADRINLTTYYYEAEETREPVRLTRFMGWPGETIIKHVLKGQFHLRMLGQKVGAAYFTRNSHIDHAG